MNFVTDHLSSFETISLKELETATLMDRTEIKFSFNQNKLGLILEKLKTHYKCLTINQRQLNSYQTLYYDTIDLGLYLKHHNGNLNRLKIRKRTYLDTGISFLEIKQKNNKGRTSKERMKIKSSQNNLQEAEINFLNNKLEFDPKDLNPIIWIDYQRMTFLSKSSEERLTIDLNLKFRLEDQEFFMSNIVIAEVKQESRSTSCFFAIMKELRIKPNSISKYCLGLATTKKSLKQNNFKERITNLKAILEDDNPAINN